MQGARIGLAIGLAAALGAAPALAHRFNVFAWVEGETVVVEGKFSNGNLAKSGTIKVFDGGDQLLRTLEMGPEGTARFPLEGAEEGLRIEMSTGDGHDDYWILTPADIQAQHDEAAD
jgi:nickel transport protein